MANLNFDSTPLFEENSAEAANSFIENNNEMSLSVEENKQEKNAGMSHEELNDPNKIVVTIADKNTPVVVLYGPAQSGKTMTLVRLARWFKDSHSGYMVRPIRTFRLSYDENYTDICKNFDNMIDSDDAARSTERINFMLVEVLKGGCRICQILEAPGEYYFDRKAPNAPYPAFVNTIINERVRKIWCVIVEPDWYDESDRRKYVTRITNLKQCMHPSDKTIFLFNKIDKTPFVISRGKVNMAQARREVGENLYPGLFNAFKNVNPITKFFNEYNCEFLPFHTGTYNESMDGYTFVPGAAEYPAKLWQTIEKLIKG